MKKGYGVVSSPCFVLEEELLRRNLEIIKEVSDRAEIEIILAFKGFSMWSAFPVLKEYINGATASSLNELRLCEEEMHNKAHSYFVAYKEKEFDQVIAGSSHITFNSLSQCTLFEKKIKEHKETISFGLRVNPEYSEVTTDLYNPAAPTSRLGVTAREMPKELPEGIAGLHFHVLCESDSFALENTLKAFEKKFLKHLKKVKWINLGGGHLMTRKGYDIDHLIQVLTDFKKKHQVEIIMEPGSAFAWQTGKLFTEVIDIVQNGGIKTAIIDASFTCHMPDCLEMPYNPVILGANREGKGDEYVIGGLSCLAGDYIKGYFFPDGLKIGDAIIFDDMIHYTMVKTSTFNGIHHPSIGILNQEGELKIIREFQYNDYKNRLS